jgi:hypothetical protein
MVAKEVQYQPSTRFHLQDRSARDQMFQDLSKQLGYDVVCIFQRLRKIP